MTVGVPGPVTDTEKFTPASAELLWMSCFEFRVTSVRRPMTAEGLITNTLPLPLDVLMPATALPMHWPVCAVQLLVPSGFNVHCWTHDNPPVIVPLLSMVHAIGLAPFPVVEYEKFPLLCAKELAAKHSIATARTAIHLLFIVSPFLGA